jgi:hypothetical protein
LTAVGIYPEMDENKELATLIVPGLGELYV